MAKHVESEEVSQESQKFHILLMLTDGQISDMDETIKQIVAASVLPMSIVIVGVGSANFRSMDKLDSDDAMLYSRLSQKHADADIVQFVPFNEFRDDPTNLARETLREIPGQLLSWMGKQGFIPNTAPVASQSAAAAAGENGEEEEEEKFFSNQRNYFVNSIVARGAAEEDARSFVTQVGFCSQT